MFTSLAAFAAAAALVLCLVVCGELFEKPDTLRHAALMMTDLDNLKKTINDTYGHETGDMVLKEVALRLTRNIRETDTAARNGLHQIEALRGQGLLDTPDRRAWQAHLLGLQGKLQLDKLEWELGPFAPAASRDDAPSTSQASALRRSTLHLKGEIAHEGQLLALLDQPPGSASGSF